MRVGLHAGSAVTHRARCDASPIPLWCASHPPLHVVQHPRAATRVRRLVDPRRPEALHAAPPQPPAGGSMLPHPATHIETCLPVHLLFNKYLSRTMKPASAGPSTCARSALMVAAAGGDHTLPLLPPGAVGGAAHSLELTSGRVSNHRHLMQCKLGLACPALGEVHSLLVGSWTADRRVCNCTPTCGAQKGCRGAP